MSEKGATAGPTPTGKAAHDPPGALGAPRPLESGAVGVRWSSLSAIGQQVVRMAFALVLARLLGPANYGVVAQAMVYVLLASVLLDQGLGAALVHKRDLRTTDIGGVVWANLATVAVLGAVTLAAAPLVADFFNTPALSAVLRVLVVDLALKGMTVVPLAMLTRHQRFRDLAAVELVAVVVGGTTGLAAAGLGMEHWSLVVQVIVADAIVLAGFLLRAGIPPLRGSLEAVRSMRRFSSNLLGFQLLNFLSRNLDDVLIGRQLGPTALAHYSLSYRTMMLPVWNLAWTVNRVAYPIYARLQDDVERMRRQFLRATGLVSLLSFPLMALVFVCAPRAIPFAFGEAWAPAVVPMQILTFTGMRQSVHALVGPVFMATGRTDWQFRFQLGASAVYIGSFFAGLPWGVAGVAVGLTVAGFLLAPAELYLVARLIGFSASEYLSALAPAVGAATAAALGCWAALTAIAGQEVPLLWAFAGGAVCGGAAMLATLRLLWPGALAHARSFAAAVVVGRASAAAG